MRLSDHRACGALTAVVQQVAGRLHAHTVLQVPAGRAVYRVGDPTDHLYLLLSGRVQVRLLGPGGQEFILRDYGPGEAFGELCFCEVRARQEEAWTLEDSRVARLGLDELGEFAQGEGLWEIVEMFAHRMGELERQLWELTTFTVRQRLQRWLLEHAGRPGPDGMAPVEFRLTHQELAGRLFTTREQISQHLGELRRQGLVRTPARGVLWVNVPGLQRLLRDV